MPNQPAVNTSPYAIAVRSTVITPQPGQPGQLMAGYGWNLRMNIGEVARDLRAQCAVIYDSGFPNILVRLDVLGLPPSVHQRIRDQVVANGYVGSSSDFMISASHTHSGPALGERPDMNIMYDLTPDQQDDVDNYATILVGQIINLIEQTRQAPSVPVNLTYGLGSVNISVNRCGLPWNPPDTPVLVARSTANNAPVAILFGHGCHAVSRGGDPVFDSDYPGKAAELIEAAFGCPALFFQGAAGDLNPDNGGSDAAVVDVGTRLGDAVIQTVRQGRFSTVTGPIRTELVEVQLPFCVNPSDPAVAARLITKYQNRLNSLGSDDLSLAAARHANQMLADLKGTGLPAGLPMFMQCWKFGTSLTVLATGNELLSGFHVGLHQLYTQAPLWLMAYTNEVTCYCPADDVLWHRAPNPNYESGWDTDPELAGIGSSIMAYGWPTSFVSTQPAGSTPASPNSVEGIIVANARSLLGI